LTATAAEAQASPALFRAAAVAAVGARRGAVVAGAALPASMVRGESCRESYTHGTCDGAAAAAAAAAAANEAQKSTTESQLARSASYIATDRRSAGPELTSPRLVVIISTHRQKRLKR